MVVVTDEAFSASEYHDDPGVRFIVNHGRRDCVTGWNLAAKVATGGVFVQVSDDLVPPAHWDDFIGKVIAHLRKQRSDVVLNLLDDGMCRSKVFHPVLTREAYEKLGYLYPSDFESMYCDDWFFAYHSKNSLYQTSEEPFWRHLHRFRHEVEVDEVMIRHEAPERLGHGKRLLDKYVQLQRLGCDQS